MRPEKEIGGILGDFERGWNTAKPNFKYYIFALETSNNCNYDGNIIKNPKAFDLRRRLEGHKRRTRTERTLRRLGTTRTTIRTTLTRKRGRTS